MAELNELGKNNSKEDGNGVTVALSTKASRTVSIMLPLAGIKGEQRIKVDFPICTISPGDEEVEPFSLCRFQDILNPFLEESIMSCVTQLSRTQKTGEQIF